MVNDKYVGKEHVVAEICYHNRFHMTDEILTEYIEAAVRRRPWKGAAVIIVIAALAALNSFRNGNWMSALVFLLCLFIVGTALLVTPNRTRKAAEKNRGKSLAVSVTFSHCIEQTIGEETRKIEYKDVTAIYYLPHVWAVLSGNGQNVLLEPNSFDDIQPEEFRHFLEARCGSAAVYYGNPKQ